MGSIPVHLHDKKRKMSYNTKEQIYQARSILEELDDNHSAMTVGFDNETYILTKEQIVTIARALYLADCEINNQ